TISLSKTESDVIRRVPLVMMVGERRVPTLSIEALRVGQGAGSHILKTTTGSGETDLRGHARTVSMRVGGAVVPLDGDGTLRVRYSGAVNERVIPAHRILDIGGLSDDIAADLAGKIVFVGASAAVLFDVKTTPLTPRISGVHVHAEIVEQILDGAYLTNPDWAPGMERLAMVVAGLAVVCLLSLGMAWWGLGVMVAAVGSITVGSWFAFSELDMLLSPAFSSFGVLMPYLAVSGYKFFTAEASRREITRQFEHFVAPEVIQDIIDDPQSHLTPGGAQRDLSIMFLDVRRFSTITEKMDPQEVIAFINTLLTPLTDAIIDEEGTIDKYMGDAVMAFWNAPRRTDDHAGHAVRAMLAFNPVMDRLNAGFARQGLPEIDIGVGINTGECSVGNMGSLKRLAYSCVGDSVNLAARLEGQTKAYGVRNLVGSATAALVRGRFALFELDQVAVKGRGQPEAIYTVAGDKSVLSSPLCGELTQHLARARAGYLARDWEGAESAYDLAATVGSVGCFDPQPLARIMKQRIDQYRADPPPVDWDGVFIATSK
ncbi:MAG: adenylate/guanylate cyclase domain-containing protein, partial [Pseudomonadota bacterium]